MNYKTLSQNDTLIWLGNLEKTIAFSTFLFNKWVERQELMDTQYKERYRTGWRKFFYEDDAYWITPFGGVPYAFGGMFKLRLLDPLTESEMRLKWYAEEYDEKIEDSFKKTHQRWAKYAKQPFEISESDVVFYQKMQDWHFSSVNIAKRLGIDYETFNLDEDSSHSS